MTTCMFVCNNEEENMDLSNRIVEAVKDWEVHEKKEIIICRMTGKEGEFRVYFSVEDKVKASVSISFEASENTGKHYELVLVKDGEKRVLVPADIKATIYYESPSFENQ